MNNNNYNLEVGQRQNKNKLETIGQPLAGQNVLKSDRNINRIDIVVDQMIYSQRLNYEYHSCELQSELFYHIYSSYHTCKPGVILKLNNTVIKKSSRHVRDAKIP